MDGRAIPTEQFLGEPNCRARITQACISAKINWVKHFFCLLHLASAARVFTFGLGNLVIFLATMGDQANG
jgi:hypothetical protein